jgi:predicted metal-dependent hydrolase
MLPYAIRHQATVSSMKTDRITYKGRVIEYTIDPQTRVTRNIHLRTDREGGLVVVAPKRTSLRAIRIAMQDMAPRVVRFLLTARTRLEDTGPLHYQTGEPHLFLGSRYPLEVSHGRNTRTNVELAGDRIFVTTPDKGEERMRKLMRNWYREQAQEYFSKRLQLLTERAPWTKDKPMDMRLRRMTRTWGNCSSKGMITLNPHLVKAPSEIVDYVITHELCHIEEMNHSKAFYALQAQINPEWQRQRAQLRADGHIYLHD